MSHQLLIYTDGAARGNPGPGGYGIVLIWGDKQKEISAGYRLTTNNRMELMAVIVALESLNKQGIPVTIYTDSKYIVDSVQKGWLDNWIRTQFKGGIKKLQEKWGLAPVQFWLVILTFALGGSLSGRLCSYLLKMAFSEKNWAFWLVYPLVLTILWPFSVLFVSFFTGQFRFFKGYLGRVGAKLMGGIGAGAGPVATGAVVAGARASNPVSSVPIHVALFAS